MASDQQPEEKPPFPAADLFFFVVGTVVAAPLGKAGIDAFMVGDYWRATLALIAGILLATAAFSFRYWESHLGEPTRKLIQDLASKKEIVAVAILVLAAYSIVVAPDFYEAFQRRTTAGPLGTKQQIENLQSQAETLQSKLNAANEQKEAALSNLADVRSQLEAAQRAPQPSQTSPPLAPDGGPIIWDSNLNWVQSGDLTGTIFLALTIRGTNGPLAVQLKDAYLLSGITGERRPMMVDGGYDGKIPINETNVIPPGAPINLVAQFTPPLRIRDFVEQWTKIFFKAEYNEMKYTKLFDENVIQSMLRVFPDAKLGPRVTRKNTN